MTVTLQTPVQPLHETPAGGSPAGARGGGWKRKFFALNFYIQTTGKLRDILAQTFDAAIGWGLEFLKVIRRTGRFDSAILLLYNEFARG